MPKSQLPSWGWVWAVRVVKKQRKEKMFMHVYLYGHAVDSRSKGLVSKGEVGETQVCHTYNFSPKCLYG